MLILGHNIETFNNHHWSCTASSVPSDTLIIELNIVTDTIFMADRIFSNRRTNKEFTVQNTTQK